MHESINIHVFMEAIINIHDASHCSECSQHSLSHSFCRYYDGARRTADSSQNVEGALNRVAQTEVVNNISSSITFKVFFVKLREREGQRVDLGRSLKGHLWMVDGGWWYTFP